MELHLKSVVDFKIYVFVSLLCNNPRIRSPGWQDNLPTQLFRHMASLPAAVLSRTLSSSTLSRSNQHTCPFLGSRCWEEKKVTEEPSPTSSELDLELAQITSILGSWEKTEQSGQPVWLGSLVHYVPLYLESREGGLDGKSTSFPAVILMHTHISQRTHIYSNLRIV